MKHLLILWIVSCQAFNSPAQHTVEVLKGAIVRGTTDTKKIALVFTGDEYGDGLSAITKTLNQKKVLASFFLTGRFYRNPEFKSGIKTLVKRGHYLGAHSDAHLLYCDWSNRDSLLVSRQQFTHDLENNYRAMRQFGIGKKDASYFLPPFEWYNDTISAWTQSLGFMLINFTPGTLSHADYTTPNMPNYRSSEKIYESIVAYEEKRPSGLNGFILLCHVGTAPERTDKFYLYLNTLIAELTLRGYEFLRIDNLLKTE